MGVLVDGTWTRDDSQLTSPQEVMGSITAGGPFPPEPNRYALYVCAGCPFAARPWAVVTLLGLEEVIEVIRVYPSSAEDGFFMAARSDEEAAMVSQYAGICFDKDPQGLSHLHQVYTASDPTYSGRVSVPVFWDKQTGKIVSNQSMDTAQMIAEHFVQFAAPERRRDLFPAGNGEAVRAMCQKVGAINGIPYGIHMAADQAGYNTKAAQLYTMMDEYEVLLAAQPYLLGSTPTVADLQLFATLIRYDLVYYPLFRCTKGRLQDFPALHAFVHRVLALPGLANCVDIDAIKLMYHLHMGFHRKAGLFVPLGPDWFGKQTDPRRAHHDAPQPGPALCTRSVVLGAVAGAVAGAALARCLAKAT